MTEPMPAPAAPPPAPRSPLALVGIVLATAAAVLLLGGILYAFASADAQRVDATARFRLLGQAANPFLAFLAVAAIVVVVAGRGAGDGSPLPAQAAHRAAMGVATTACIVITLLAVNGVLTDFTSGASSLFRLSAVVSRLGTIALSGFGLWLASVAKPPR